MKPTKVREKFAAWVADAGGQRAAAEAIGATQQAVSLVCLGKRTPCLEIAVAIERATKGRIRCRDWVTT